jgi:hypothetical protein
MRRAITIGIAALAMALPAPALATSQLRHFEGDLSPVGVSSQQQPGGVMALDVVFNDKQGPRFTPRHVVGVRVSRMPLICLNQPGQDATQEMLSFSMPVNGRFDATFRSPNQGKPKPNRYSYSVGWGFIIPSAPFAGSMGARLYKPQGRGPIRGLGNIYVGHYDLPAPGSTNCTSNGLRGWSGRQCRLASEDNPQPLCRLH